MLSFFSDKTALLLNWELGYLNVTCKENKYAKEFMPKLCDAA